MGATSYVILGVRMATGKKSINDKEGIHIPLWGEARVIVCTSDL